MGSPLFKADYLNEQTMLSPNLYNCTEMANPEAGIYPTYNNSGKWVYEFSECAPPAEKCNKCASVLGLGGCGRGVHGQDSGYPGRAG